MKVTICGTGGLPEIVSNVGIKTRERRRAMDVVLERQVEFLAVWHDLHGDG